MKQWQELRIERLTQLRPIQYPAELPIVENSDRIREAIHNHQVVIVAGDTGSGKTTQLPKMCLELQRGRAGRIGHTQPRRIAAHAVAQRIAEELQTALGDVVGYKTRFGEKLSPQCAIKLMTDGILLAEMQHDKKLYQYDTLIIDEAHERSVNIDFILGYLKKLLPKRPNLKVIVTSATLDVKRFATYFNNAPIIEVAGRSYPIEMIYKTPLEESEDSNQLATIINAIEALLEERGGDILVFLPTERVIHEVAKLLKDTGDSIEILPLYSRLAFKDQRKIFTPSTKLRVVLATNVAETSLTVPGIRYVIDEGTARVSRYSQRMKVQRLPIERISQASASQRAGRCGRVGPGKCIRLYSRDDFESRDAYTLPEILRTNLAQIILRMTALKLGKIEEFPFIQPPDPRYINDGYQLLTELGALDAQRQLTRLGEKMSRLTIDPRLSRLLIAGSEHGCLNEMILIGSFLEAQDPRLRPKEKMAQADQAHAPYNDKKSDFITILNLWNSVAEKKRTLSKNQFKQFCEKNYISLLRFNEWHEIQAQLQDEASGLQLSFNQQPPSYDMLHTALLYGFFTRIACKQEKNDYLGTRGNRIKIFPGSAVFKTKPQWIMAGLLLETEQLYAHLVAEIDPAWVISVAPQWIKRHYGEPCWEKSSQRVTANCRITLLGLTLSDKQRVNYENIDPLVARELFIRGALVHGEWIAPLDFFLKNQQALEEAKQLEEQSRRRDIVIDEELLQAFYADNLPIDITGIKKLEKWYRQASPAEQQQLLLTPDFIIRGLTEGITGEKFPGHIFYEGKSWPLSYHFAPGASDDGISMTMSLESITQAPFFLFEWLVPGFLPEKVAHLLRTLPKLRRKKLMPLQEVVQHFVKTHKANNQPLLKALTDFLAEKYHQTINDDEWLPQELPAHLFMLYKIVDKQGTLVACSRDGEALSAQLADQAKALQNNVIKDSLPQFTKMTRWACGDLLDKLKTNDNNGLSFYPALHDDGETVSVVYLQEWDEAAAIHRRGVLRLLAITLRAEVAYLKKTYAYFKNKKIAFCSSDELIDDLILASLNQCFFAESRLPRTAAQFQDILIHKKNLIAITQKKAEQLDEIINLAAALHVKRLSKEKPALQPLKKMPLSELKSLNTMKALLQLEADSAKPQKTEQHPLAQAHHDMDQQLHQLLYPGFILNTPPQYWLRLPIYLQGMALRLQKLANNPHHEKNVFPQFETALAKYQQLLQNDPTLRKLKTKQRSALETYRWMLEEYRLSLFSQPLKTVVKVSDKRMESLWVEFKQA